MQNHGSRAQVAYILKGFPRTSETFITNEIHLLETLGLELSIFSIKQLEGQKHHAVVDAIRAPVTYLPQASDLTGHSFLTWLSENLPKFAPSHGRLLLKRPVAYLGGLLECLGMSLKYRSGRLEWPRTVFIKEFLQAGYIAEAVLQNPAIRHLHAHFCHGATTIVMLASRISGLPFSFTAHAKDIYLKELNPGDLLQIKMRRAKFAVTCTGANQEHLDACKGSNIDVHRIYHGLDTDLFVPEPRKQALSEQIPTILSVGRLVEKKGFDYLVRACAILRDRGVRFNCRIVGGADKYAQVIQQLISDLDLQDIVSLPGAVTQEELRGIYQQGSVFALPCLVVDNGDRDGIPNVLVEAMAMEMPVISSDISGIPELIQDQVNGLLVPEKNAQAMADAIQSLLDDQALRLRLGQAARQTVCRDFNSRHTTVALKNLFDACLQGQTVEAHVCCAEHS
ncbi:glycosyltransferase [Methylomonas sp. MK1]|uniref:glycosyltransferase n=1 Tax=Methylomonas sp. MK1 TaxID=1131552 RepID=UPI00036F983D|nr:glycosyltransferase [Methylomonas sp. MK1]